MTAQIISYDYFTARRIAKAVVKELDSAPTDPILWEPPDLDITPMSKDALERLHADLYPPKEGA